MMEERDLVSIVEQEVSAAVGYPSGELSSDRAQELDYYNSKLFGNEVEGESQVVSSDVFDTVEGMLPSLLRIFTASDDVVRFDPNGPEDEEQAAQQTETCNYVFYRQNNGFLVLYEWFKDALIQKNGVVKYWWEEKTSTSKEEYRGLSEGQYLKLEKDSDTEILEHSEYEDRVAIEQREEKIQELVEQAQKAGMPPAQVPLMKQGLVAQVNALPIPTLHDVKIKVVKDASKTRIEVVPPEEFGISQKHKCVSIQDTPFCYQRTKKTISDLREMGCPEDVLARAGGEEDGGRDYSEESIARDRLVDQQQRPPTEPDPSAREIWVTDCFIRLDEDGDGVAELRHIIKPGNAIWVNEECDHINFAALTPIIMPHRWVGKSVAELVMADQFTKSVIWRQMLNNLYLTNNPRKAVLSSPSGVPQADLDDLMDSRAGAIMREYTAGAIRNEETPFVAAASFPMLEYIDQQKEVRTGQTRYSQGTDADSLNKTARGIQLIQQAGQQRGDLIARIFAETGVKDLMRGIAYMLSKYSTKAMTVRLRNKWVEVDPRNWKTQFDMIVNVGLGTGNKDVQLAHLNVMGQKQMELMQTGRGHLVTDDNVYNLYKKTSEAMGFKHPELFVSDPASVKKPQPQPSPDLLKIQSEADEVRLKIRSNEATRRFDAQTQKELEAMKSRTLINIEQMNIEKDKALEKMRLDHEAQLAIYKSDNTLTDEAKKLELRALEISQGEQALEFKKNLEQLVEEHKDGLTAGSDERHALIAQDMMLAVKDSMASVASEINAVAQLLGAMQNILVQQMNIQVQTRDGVLNPKPRAISLSDLKVGKDGLVTGATVTPTLQ